jgi:hypothetical protein
MLQLELKFIFYTNRITHTYVHTYTLKFILQLKLKSIFLDLYVHTYTHTYLDIESNITTYSCPQYSDMTGCYLLASLDPKP